MIDNCLFCNIVAGKQSAHKVYEDDEILAFLDVEPVNPGHTLVIPKQHVEVFWQLDEPTYTHLMQVVRKLSERVQSVIKPERVGLLIAGFDVPHAHVHIVPMHEYDDLKAKQKAGKDMPRPSHEGLECVAQDLRP